MTDEANTALALTDNLIAMGSVSVDVLGAKLALAEASLASAEANRQEAISAAKTSAAYVKASADAEHARSVISTFNDLQRAGIELTGEQAEDYSRFVGKLQEAVATQERIVATAGALSPEYDKATAQVEYLKTLLEQSTGETVNLGNAMSPPVSLAAQMQGYLSGVAGNLNAATGAASGLANMLAGAANAAIQLANAAAQAVASLGGVASGLSSLSVRAGAISQSLGVVSKLAGVMGKSNAVKSAGDRLKKMGNYLGVVHSASVRSAVSMKAFEKSVGGAGGGAGKAAKAVKSVGDAASGAGEKVRTLAEQIKDTLPSAVTSLSDTLADGLLNGFKGTGEKLIDVFKNMLKKMISLAIANPIKIALGLTGGAAGASGGGGLLSGLTGGGGGLLKGALGGLGKTGGILGMGGLGGGTGFLGGLGNAVSGGLGGIFKIGSAASAAGGGLMASLGAAVPVVGAVAAAISFFKKKVTELDTGIQGSVSGMDAAIKSFRTIETKRFWGLSKKTSTSTSDLSGGPMADAIADMQRGIMDTAKTLGFGADAFKGFSHSFKLSLKGLSEDEKARKIAEEIQSMGDAFAGMIPHISSVNELIAAASQRYDLETRLLQAQGKESELIARHRQAELAATNALNHSLLRQVWAAEDAAKAEERQKELDGQIKRLGRTRFEAEMLVAAKRRGEVTLNRASQGLSQTQDLVRLDAVEQNTGENTKLMRKLVNYFEGWDVNGIPLET
mgnify:CR=1 FL=1